MALDGSSFGKTRDFQKTMDIIQVEEPSSTNAWKMFFPCALILI